MAFNGVWKIANVTSTTYELVGSAGNVVYSAEIDKNVREVEGNVIRTSKETDFNWH